MRTGRKYCYLHRSLGRGIRSGDNRREKAKILLSIMGFTIFALIINGYLKEGGNIFWVYFWVLLIIIILVIFHVKKTQNNINQ